MSALIASLLAAVATLVGGFLIIYRFEWAKQNGDRLTAFAAGVLVSMSLVEVVPEAVSSATKHAGIWAAIGFLAMYFLEHFAGDPHCAEDECPERDISLLAYVAVLLHSLLDGVALAAGEHISEEFGVIMAIGVLLHEFPEGLASGALLLHRGFSRKKIFFLIAVVAFATPMGALLGTYVLPSEGEPTWIFPFLAAIAGTFIYTGVAGLLIHSHRKKDRFIIISFLIGFSVFLVRGLFLH